MRLGAEPSDEVVTADKGASLLAAGAAELEDGSDMVGVSSKPTTPCLGV